MWLQILLVVFCLTPTFSVSKLLYQFSAFWGEGGECITWHIRDHIRDEAIYWAMMGCRDHNLPLIGSQFGVNENFFLRAPSHLWALQIPPHPASVSGMGPDPTLYWYLNNGHNIGTSPFREVVSLFWCWKCTSSIGKSTLGTPEGRES